MNTAEEALEALRDLAPGAGQVLGVAGGDGTVQAVLSALEELRPEAQWPAFMAIPAGSSNMTHYDHAGVRKLDAYVEAMCAWLDGVGDGVDRVQRNALRVERPGERPLVGFFFGTGAVARGVRFFEERLRDVRPHEWTSLLAILRILAGLVMGDAERSGAVRTRTVPDGGEPDEALALLHLATTLDRLLLGMRPYWGTGDAPIHFTRVEADASWLFANLWRLALGRPGSSLRPERGYLSREVRRLEVTLDGDWVLDGELYRARSEDGPLVVSAARRVEWIVPR